MMAVAMLVFVHPDSLPCLALSSVMLLLMVSSGIPGNVVIIVFTSCSNLAAFPDITGGEEVVGGVTGTEGGDRLRLAG